MRTVVWLFFVLLNYSGYSFPFTASINRADSCRKRKLILYSSSAIGYTGTMTALYFTWYRGYPMSQFHFFNDNDQWLMMDKAGHAFSSYQLHQILYQAASSSCMSDNHAMLFSTSASFFMLSSIEIFDGFSSQWGASWGDIIANAAGISLFSTQQILFNKQIIRMKFSYFPSRYPKYRPSLLGNNHLERILKDYNGQTYWLSIAPAQVMTMKFIPRWLCLSFGYGINGMISAHQKIPETSDIPFSHMHQPSSQFYISFDIDWQQLPASSQFTRHLFFLLNILKFPSPALLISDNQLKFMPIMF